MLNLMMLYVLFLSFIQDCQVLYSNWFEEEWGHKDILSRQRMHRTYLRNGDFIIQYWKDKSSFEDINHYYYNSFVFIEAVESTHYFLHWPWNVHVGVEYAGIQIHMHKEASSIRAQINCLRMLKPLTVPRKVNEL